MKRNYVNFSTASLLKEKGFDVPCHTYYEKALKSSKDSQDGYCGSFGWKKGEINLQQGYIKNNDTESDYSNKNWFLCAAPELWVAQEWMWDKHGFWIAILTRRYGDGAFKTSNRFFAEISFGDLVTTLDTYETPQESLESAIVYLLNSLT